jgi:hypothetical protein
MRVSAVAKTIVALVGSAIAVVAPLVGDGLLTTTDGVQIAVAVLTALGVFAVPNAPQAPVAPVRSVREQDGI